MRKRPAEERFWEKVTKGRGCWEWTAGKIPTGYGHFRFGDRQAGAHIFSWELHYPSKKIGKLCVLHRCDNPGCVNPKHLFLGTHADNAKDRDKKSRQAKGVKQGNSKLTESQVLKIYKDPRSHRKIASDFRLSQVHVSRIKRGATWAHLTKHF